MADLTIMGLIPQVKKWLEEDDLTRNLHYTRSLPTHPVELRLKIKSPLLMAGMDYLSATFVALGLSPKHFDELRRHDGHFFNAGEEILFNFSMPFSVAVTGERLALNLLQHGCSVATWTRAHVDIAEPAGVKVLDTRKTTPGLRSLEKYAVRVGGGHNHRLGQTDVWMIKDNHKSSLGGLSGALKFFQDQGAFYNNIVAEIHDIKEMREAVDLGIRHVLLDNFTPDKIREALKLKREGMSVEVSGGVKLATMKDFLIRGVDAVSVGSLTYGAPRVDISLKFKAL
jgi:nicotinate-nucleotide pyrophosphorylase (carboxylating)